MIAFLRKLFAKHSTPDRAPPARPAAAPSPVAVRFDDWGIYATVQGDGETRLAWNEIDLIAIRIEDSFLPFPYWYVGNEENLLRIPNDAQGGHDLFFDAFPAKIPGYDNDATFRTIIEASGAIEGSFIVWRSADADA